MERKIVLDKNIMGTKVKTKFLFSGYPYLGKTTNSYFRCY